MEQRQTLPDDTVSGRLTKRELFAVELMGSMIRAGKIDDGSKLWEIGNEAVYAADCLINSLNVIKPPKSEPLQQ